MKTLTLPLAGLLLLASLQASLGQDFTGRLSSGLGSFIGSEDLSSRPSTFDGKIEGGLGSSGLELAHYSIDLRASFDPQSGQSSLALREAWMKLSSGPFDLSIGNQIVAWGATDVFTPIDAVNSNDLSLPVDAQKIPQFMGRLALSGPGISLDMVVLPFWTASILPGARWQSAMSLPAGVTNTIVSENPSPTLANLQYGGRLKASWDLLQGIDLGLVLYRGRNSLPRLSTVFTSPNTAMTTRTYDPYYLAGMDAVLAFDGGLLLKGEAAYKVLNEADWIDPSANNAKAEAVGGWEYTIFGVKTTGEYVIDWTKGSSATGDTWAQSLVFIASMAPDSRWSLKAIGVYNFDGSSLLSPQLTYTIADGLDLEARFFAFLGDSGSVYGKWTDNDLADIALNFSF